VVVRDDAEAAAVADDIESGLVAAIQTGSVERGDVLAGELRTGIVHINDQTVNGDPYAPFGGTGMSGNGSRFESQRSLGRVHPAAVADPPRPGTRLSVLSSVSDGLPRWAGQSFPQRGNAPVRLPARR
jgi:acyl-CoA reductase-like NAD-dependent aldehyde dehydrogenase